MSATTDISICSAALQLLGDSGISSFAGSDRAKLCGNIYPLLKLGILGQFDWKFSVKQASLTQLTESPNHKWTFKYALPPDRLDDRVIAAYATTSIGAPMVFDFEIQTGVLLTDFATMSIDYQGDPATESVWPTYFVWFMVKAMEVALTFPITDQNTKENSLYLAVYGTPGEAGVGGLYGLTRARNSGSDPATPFQNFTLIDARFEGIG